MDNLLIIGGPTGIGKTEISLKLARELNGEIISADSMAIYKHMDIGSAKICRNEMQGIKHHLIDIIEPFDTFNASNYKDYAKAIIKDITKRGKLPMIVGGTGLYISCVIDNYSFTEAIRDEQYRNYLQEVALTNGNEYVHEMLKDIDNESYIRLHPNNLKRVIRALEVYKFTGKCISEYNIKEDEKKESEYNINYFALTMDRGKLYERIDSRVDIMMNKGLASEVKNLKESGCNADMQSMKGIGYKEILSYLDGAISYDESIDLIKKNSRNYAKRQLTWFRNDKRVIWFNKDELTDDEIVEKIIEKINKNN